MAIHVRPLRGRMGIGDGVYRSMGFHRFGLWLFTFDHFVVVWEWRMRFTVPWVAPIAIGFADLRFGFDHFVVWYKMGGNDYDKVTKY